ncbi:MAG: hypothetical protein ABI462_10625, partial [Ignavibacteria bacterium]
GLFESRNRFFSMLTISGIPFQQVYGNYISPGGNDPREIYYTIARGIVAFSKEDGKVWGLKEIY